MLKSHSTESRAASPLVLAVTCLGLKSGLQHLPIDGHWAGYLTSLCPSSLPCIMGLRTVPAYDCVVRINEM